MALAIKNPFFQNTNSSKKENIKSFQIFKPHTWRCFSDELTILKSNFFQMWTAVKTAQNNSSCAVPGCSWLLVAPWRLLAPFRWAWLLLRLIVSSDFENDKSYVDDLLESRYCKCWLLLGSWLLQTTHGCSYTTKRAPGPLGPPLRLLSGTCFSNPDSLL